MSLFSALFGDPQSTDPSVAPAVTNNGVTTVDPVTLIAAKKASAAAPVASADPLSASTGPSGPLNYDNSAAVKAVQGALAANPPQGGSDNPGIFGLLPQNVQHGTLRNVLGALGDAFLVQGGRQPAYQEHMQRQEIGNAMAGYDPNDPNSVQAAISRVAATGAPGADTMADQMQKNWNDLQSRKAMMEYNQQYREQMIGSKNDAALARMTPLVGGMVAGITDPAQYAAKYQMADAIAKRIGPNYSAQDFGLPAPEDWQPGMTSTTGMTANNVAVSGDKAAQRSVSERDTDVNANSRVVAAGIGADSHKYAADASANKPTEGTIIQYLTDKQNRGETLTPAEQSVWKKYTSVRGGHGMGLAPGLVPAGSGATTAPTSGGPNLPRDQQGNYVAGSQPLTSAQAANLPAGHNIHFLGHDGQWHIRP